jgi:NADH-quinone oxidoreductase subunit N
VKRILAYSAVSHTGFMLIAISVASQLGARALMYYLVPYAAASVGAFGVVAARERELGRGGVQRLRGGRERPAPEPAPGCAV